MADNLVKVAEIVLRKLQATGAPLAAPTADDVMVISYGQDISIEEQFNEGERIESKGPDGVICALEDDDEFTGVVATGNIAKWPQKLKHLAMGGSYVKATDLWTPPMRGKINVAPLQVELYAEKYSDGENTESDLVGYEKIVFPKAKIKLGALEISNSNFSGGSLTIEGKDYVAADPANSKPCYYFDTMASSLPSAGSYAVPFNIVDGSGALVGVLVSVTVNGSAVTDTTDASGDAELSLPVGVHSVTISKTEYTSQTFSIVVGLVNDEISKTMVAS